MNNRGGPLGFTTRFLGRFCFGGRGGRSPSAWCAWFGRSGRFGRFGRSGRGCFVLEEGGGGGEGAGRFWPAVLLDSCGVDAEVGVTVGTAEGGLEVLVDAFRPRATRPAGGAAACAWEGGLGAGLGAGWRGCGPPPGDVKNETSVCARIG